MRGPEGEAVNWIAEYAASNLSPEDVRRLALMTDAQIIAQVGEYQADEELRRDLHASTAAHWHRFLSSVTREPFEVHPPPQAFDLARTIARRGLEVTVLVKTYRVAQRAVWDYVAESVAEQIVGGDLRSAVLVRFWDRVSQWIDGSVDMLVTAYSHERDQWCQGALARRADAVRSLLRGADLDIDATATLLGYPLRRRHTAFVLWSEDDGSESDSMHALQAAATALGIALGCPHSLSVSSGARGLWGWAGTFDAPEPAALAEVTLPAGVRAALGTTASGVPGFVRSHHEALAGQSAAITGETDHALTRYADVELACLAAGIVGLPGMRAMIERELGGLAATDDATDRLRHTVSAYLACGGNTDLAGKALRVHRNTVRYRIRQAEHVIGHPIQQRQVYLELALHCVEVFGQHALGPRDGD